MFVSQMQWSRLWTVTTNVQQTNERAAGITVSPNPARINPYMTHVLFNVWVSAKVDLPLAAVRVYGAGSASAFPAVNTPAEALWHTVTDLAVNTGLLRIPFSKREDGVPAAGIMDQVRLLPEFLLLEYSTGAVGAAPAITFHVDICALGPTPQGNE